MKTRGPVEPVAHRYSRVRRIHRARRMLRLVLRWWPLASRAVLLLTVVVLIVAVCVHGGVFHLTNQQPPVSQTGAR